MKKNKYVIVGAGIGGLAAAAQLKFRGEEDFIVVDKCKDLPRNLANGLHYLHSKDIGTPFEFKFKSCPITEQIWDTRTNKFSNQATLPEMFEYSKKVMENLRHPSSIMDPGKRMEAFVPESNNMNDLLDAYYDYIGMDKFKFSMDLSSVDSESRILLFNADSLFEEKICYDYLIESTPLNKFYHLCGDAEKYPLKNKELFITNYKSENIVPNWLIVLYMSDPKFPPYRITSFNNIISMESMKSLTHEDEVIIKYIIGDMFDYKLESKSEYKWETGRIFGINKAQRNEVIEDFSKKNIFPIGRFGLWNGKLTMDTTAWQAKILVDMIVDGHDYSNLKRILNG